LRIARKLAWSLLRERGCSHADDRQLERFQFQNHPAVVGIPLDVRIVHVRIIQIPCFDVRPVDLGHFLPPALAPESQESVSVPGVLMLPHELLGECLGPRTERKPGGDVADFPSLHRRESIHVRSFPFEAGAPIRRRWVRKPDDRATDVLVEVSRQIEDRPQRLLAATHKTYPSRDLPWNMVVEFPVDEVFVRTPRHPAPILAIPGNHDSFIVPQTPAASAPLAIFSRNFCSKNRVITPEAASLHRTSMVQPGSIFHLTRRSCASLVCSAMRLKIPA
jgi:hypothetical protein